MLQFRGIVGLLGLLSHATITSAVINCNSELITVTNATQVDDLRDSCPVLEGRVRFNLTDAVDTLVFDWETSEDSWIDGKDLTVVLGGPNTTSQHIKRMYIRSGGVRVLRLGDALRELRIDDFSIEGTGAHDEDACKDVTEQLYASDAEISMVGCGYNRHDLTLNNWGILDSGSRMIMMTSWGRVLCLSLLSSVAVIL